MKQREKARGLAARREQRRDARMLDAQRSLRLAVERADTLIDESLALLTKLVAVEQTMERASLIGSAYNAAPWSTAQPEGAGRMQQGPPADEQSAIGTRRSWVRRAAHPTSSTRSRIASPPKSRSTPASRDGAAWIGKPAKILRASLKAKSEDPDFWSVVGEAELDQYDALAQKKLASASTKLNRAYQDLHKRVTATRMWASVYDTACLVLPNYASRTTGKERAAANDLLAQLRTFALPGGGSIDGERDCEWTACGHDPRGREHDDGPRSRVGPTATGSGGSIASTCAVTLSVLDAVAGDDVSRSDIPREARLSCLRICISTRWRRAIANPRAAPGGLAAVVRMPRRARHPCDPICVGRHECAHQPRPPSGIVATCLAVGGAPEQGSERYNDFTSVNDLLEAVEAQIKSEFSTGVVGLIDAAGGEADDAVAMWKVRAARETAWTNAEVMWALKATPTLQRRILFAPGRAHRASPAAAAGAGVLARRSANGLIRSVLGQALSTITATVATERGHRIVDISPCPVEVAERTVINQGVPGD
jgi:hypothetical protein